MYTSNVSKDDDDRLFLAKIRLDLRSVGGNGGDVCNVVAFLERGTALMCKMTPEIGARASRMSLPK
jgi:hypothetical protein